MIVVRQCMTPLDRLPKKNRCDPILFGTIFARSEPPQTFFNFFAKLGLRPACFLRINRPMANLKPSTIRDSDIVGLKYFDRLMPLLEKLHDVGTQRDRAGNRT